MGGTIPSPVCCDGPPAAAGAFAIGHVSVCCAPATTASRSTCTATQSTIPLIRAFRCPVSPTSLIRDAAMASPAARRSAENSAAACLRNPALIIRRCRGRGRRLTMAPMTGGVPRNVEVRARPPPETVQPAPREGALQPIVTISCRCRSRRRDDQPRARFVMPVSDRPAIIACSCAMPLVQSPLFSCKSARTGVISVTPISVDSHVRERTTGTKALAQRPLATALTDAQSQHMTRSRRTAANKLDTLHH
jgi:hypothetical protein